MNKSRLLVVGASGLVGSVFSAVRDRNIIGLARAKPHWWGRGQFIEVDALSPFTNWKNILKINDSIVFLAFPTRIDDVEGYSRKEMDYLVSGFAAFIQAAVESSCRVAFVSTDAVLWGLFPKKRVPGCLPKPINKYGVLKTLCESIICSASLNGSVVIRCTPVGFHPYVTNHGFLGALLAQARFSVVRGFSNSYITPVSTIQLMKAILEWHSTTESSAGAEIVHLGTRTPITKYNLLVKLAERQGLAHAIESAELNIEQSLVPRVLDQTFLSTESGKFRGVDLEDTLTSFNLPT